MPLKEPLTHIQESSAEVCDTLRRRWIKIREMDWLQDSLAEERLSFSAILPSSAGEPACIFCITCPRWTAAVTSVTPIFEAICFVDSPEAKRSMTWRSRAVNVLYRCCKAAVSPCSRSLAE